MTQVLSETQTYIEPDPFYHAFCPIKNWKKVKKRYRDHNYEIIDPVKVGSMMEFKFISQSEYMKLISTIFQEGVQSA